MLDTLMGYRLKKGGLTELLILLISWPAVSWPPLTNNSDVDKSCVSELRLVVQRRVQGPVVAAVRLVYQNRPPFERGVFGQAVVVALRGVDDVLKLDKSTRIQVT